MGTKKKLFFFAHKKTHTHRHGRSKDRGLSPEAADAANSAYGRRNRKELPTSKKGRRSRKGAWEEARSIQGQRSEGLLVQWYHTQAVPESWDQAHLAHHLRFGQSLLCESVRQCGRHRCPLHGLHANQDVWRYPGTALLQAAGAQDLLARGAHAHPGSGWRSDRPRRGDVTTARASRTGPPLSLASSSLS